MGLLERIDGLRWQIDVEFTGRSSRQPCETICHPRPGSRMESTDHCHSARWSISHVGGSERELASPVARMVPSAFRFACSRGRGGWISVSRPGTCHITLIPRKLGIFRLPTKTASSISNKPDAFSSSILSLGSLPLEIRSHSEITVRHCGCGLLLALLQVAENHSWSDGGRGVCPW